MKTKKKKSGCLGIIIIAIVIIAVFGGINKNSGLTDENMPTVQSTAAETITESVTEKISETTLTETETVTEETTSTESESNTETTADTSTLAEDMIRPEFKEFMDSYEAFYDEYIAFMKEYENADSNDALIMMGDYMNYLTKYSEFMEKLDSIDENELTDAEALYYAEVTLRVSQKMLQAAY